MMTGILYSIMLMQISFLARTYCTNIVRMQTMMSMPIIIIMSGIICTIVLMHFFYGTVYNRVRSGASDIGDRYCVISIVHAKNMLAA